jgi:hypothetical protein
MAQRITPGQVLHPHAQLRLKALGLPRNVKVEHVHEGVQAIVGNVGTGGSAQKSKDQPHAQLTHAGQPEMRSALAENGEAVPQRCNEER